MTEKNKSPYERRAYLYLERGYSVIPIAPGTKRPGQWSEANGWTGMHDWERYGKRLPSEIELGYWEKWPDAGIGLLTGKLSGVIGLDRDYDTDGTDALDKLIPYTPVKKKGAKGYTAFFRYKGEKSCSFNINGIRVLDVLSDGRQTLMPGTRHPEGHTYIYLTEDLLEDYDPKDLPELPDDFLEQVARVLLPYQSVEDKKYQRNPAPVDNTGPINTNLSIEGEYFRDINQQALQRIDEWVTRLIPNVKPERDGFRAVATWRGAKNHNVGIHPSGIFDFGGNYGMTAVDLVMYANGLTFPKALEALRACLPMSEPEPILFGTTPNPQAKPAAPTPQAPPLVMPWQKKVEPPPVVHLPPKDSLDPAPALPTFLQNPPGILWDVAQWITATAPKSQPELALAAALALGSVVMGRNYRSRFGNYTSLYMVMVAKSTEGKEHPQACVERALTAADLPQLIGGSGYTSAGAVYSALLKNPAHVAVIDEMGKLLKMSRAKGQAHTEAAIDKLVEAYGRLDGVLRPPNYSTMTASPKQLSDNTARVVHNPAITILGATTPATFYEHLTMDLVKDGFLGRCIVVESKAPRQLTRFVDRTDPPAKIVEWCKAVHISGAVQGDLAGHLPADMPATALPMQFDDECVTIMRRFEEELNAAKDEAESDGLDVLLGRTLEKSMRVAMVACKAMDPTATVVRAEHLQWSIEYVRHYDLALLMAVREQRIEGEVDGTIKRMINYIKHARKYTDEKHAEIYRAGFITHSRLLKLMKMTARQFDEMIKTAVEGGHIIQAPVGTHTFSYSGAVYHLP